MTLRELADGADKLNEGIGSQLQETENLSDNLAATITRLRHNGVQDIPRDVDRLEQALLALGKFHADVAGIVKALDQLRADADDLACEIDSQATYGEATSDVAGMVFDVERGICSHAELLEACRMTNPSYVL